MNLTALSERGRSLLEQRLWCRAWGAELQLDGVQQGLKRLDAGRLLAFPMHDECPLVEEHVGHLLLLLQDLTDLARSSTSHGSRRGKGERSDQQATRLRFELQHLQRRFLEARLDVRSLQSFPRLRHDGEVGATLLKAVNVGMVFHGLTDQVGRPSATLHLHGVEERLRVAILRDLEAKGLEGRSGEGFRYDLIGLGLQEQSSCLGVDVYGVDGR